MNRDWFLSFAHQFSKESSTGFYDKVMIQLNQISPGINEVRISQTLVNIGMILMLQPYTYTNCDWQIVNLAHACCVKANSHLANTQINPVQYLNLQKNIRPKSIP